MSPHMANFIVRKLFGDPNDRELKRLKPIVERTNVREPHYLSASDDELRGTTARLRERLEAGETLDDLAPDAFAAVREATRRVLGKRHYDVQILAGAVLHQGKIAEMRTGEGKTQVAALPLFLNALSGAGAHLVTPNDYLSRLGGGWLGPVYTALGMTVGVITHEFHAVYDATFDDPHPHGDDRLNHWRPVERREAYLADITYGTNNEFGFDYLRDNMALDVAQQVQRPLHFAIVDEVDSILIDEARTPLIISGPAEESTDLYLTFARLAPRLQVERDYIVDEKTRSVALTEDGVEAVEGLLGVQNIYDEANFQLAHHIEQALKAQVIFRKDRDYVVKDGKVVIVDEFTGRLQFGRRYSEGLHQAIEAKEGVAIERESKTYATISYQNYFRLYRKLSGMTGTAMTESEEFHKIYHLDVVMIPTHRQMIRIDDGDLVYKNEAAKYRAVVNEIQELHDLGRPVLVGTVSIEKSEQLSSLLHQRAIPHAVLNAKFHEQEAGIIALAGQREAVTIATNMAGRGTDIVLGEGVADLGGLHIIGTERHESRRIDNQLRGRAGRQGDRGSSRFYVSLQDDLMRRFGSDRIAGIMDRLNMDEDEPIEHMMVSKAIEGAQSKVEGYNFDMRKHLVDYDDVMNEQRALIYGDRQKILMGESMRDYIVGLLETAVRDRCKEHLESSTADEWDVETLLTSLNTFVPLAPDLTPDALRLLARDEVEEQLVAYVKRLYDAREEAVGSELMRIIERQIMLMTISDAWVDHLTAMDELREGITLRAYGQRDPLVEYKREAYTMWQGLQTTITQQIVHMIFRVDFQQAPAPPPMPELHTNQEPEPEVAVAAAGTRTAPASAARARGRQSAPRGTRMAPRATPASQTVVQAQMPGRNDPCFCGSGKKYKKCHGAMQQHQAS